MQLNDDVDSVLLSVSTPISLSNNSLSCNSFGIYKNKECGLNVGDFLQTSTSHQREIKNVKECASFHVLFLASRPGCRVIGESACAHPQQTTLFIYKSREMS
jgi:hypothetical protein